MRPSEQSRPRPSTREFLRGHLRITDVLAVLAIVGTLSYIAEWRRVDGGGSSWLRIDQTDQIGAEYDTIAQAIRSGRGFSDPFRVETGPTAWMPPVLVYLTAGLYWAFGDDRTMVVEAINCLNLSSILFAGVIVVVYARIRNLHYLAYVLIAVGLAAEFDELFQRTHDTWLILLLINLLWISNQVLNPRSLSGWRVSLWGLFGGGAALCSPIVGLTWACLTVQRWLLVGWLFRRGNAAEGDSTGDPAERSSRHMRANVTWVALAAVISIAVVVPWTIRNRVVMGRWMPVKSNAIYELWQSQVLDDDGLLDSGSAYQHPWGSDSKQRREYMSLGELGFLDARKDPTWESIKETPLNFINRVLVRFHGATLYYQPLVVSDESQALRMRFNRSYFAIPFLAMLVVLYFSRAPLSPAVLSTITIYAVYLGVYVLVSYYARYAAPAVAIKMLLVLHAADAIRSAYKRRAKSSPGLVPGEDLVVDNSNGVTRQGEPHHVQSV